MSDGYNSEPSLLHYITTLEKYTIRLFDEGIDKLVNIPVVTLEDEGISRQNLSIGLSNIGLLGAVCGISATSFNVIQREVNNLYISRAMIETFCVYPLKIFSSLLFFFFDQRYILEESSMKSNNGAISIDPDVQSYNSVFGIIRPYALMGSFALVIHGMTQNNPEALFYGSGALSWSISLYTRDDDPKGGLFQKIGSKLSDLFLVPEYKPEYQPS